MAVPFYSNPMTRRGDLSLIEFTSQLLVGILFYHLGDMLSLLVDRHGMDDSSPEEEESSP